MTILFAVLGYLLGSIPFGLVLAKLTGHGDIRKIGSGNIGATNVLRTGNKKLAFATLILDSGKGAAVIFLMHYLIVSEAEHMWDMGWDTFPSSIKPHHLFIFGLPVIIGHNFPIWLKFKGGKGVATTLGVLLAAVPITGIAACLSWLITAIIFKISSLSALIATAIAPIVTFIFYGYQPTIICLIITVLVWWRHKDNIKRLIKGEEPKIGKKKDKKEKDTKNATS